MNLIPLSRAAGTPPSASTAPSSERPVIFVSEVGHARDTRNGGEHEIRGAGSGSVFTFECDVLAGGVEASALHLGDFVYTVLQATGTDSVDMVDHTRGGRVARYYADNLDGVTRLHDLFSPDAVDFAA
ncbi:MAG: hypothetical protein IT198_00485 [Acidimicrobiia bacterium]|nr:hypothetical protein [Acidimicrobiia bacterium]